MALFEIETRSWAQSILINFNQIFVCASKWSKYWNSNDDFVQRSLLDFHSNKNMFYMTWNLLGPIRKVFGQIFFLLSMIVFSVIVPRLMGYSVSRFFCQCKNLIRKICIEKKSAQQAKYAYMFVQKNMAIWILYQHSRIHASQHQQPPHKKEREHFISLNMLK